MTSPISSVHATPTPAAAGGGDGGLRKAAEAFEAVILRQLMASMRQAKLGDDNVPKWNFHKYLVGRDGQLIAAFGTKTKPDAPEVIAAVEAVLPN